jgi:hypothetical protein
MRRNRVWLVVPLLLLAATGCRSKATITGTVTYKGTPIPEGSVMFIPQDGSPVVSAVINDGKYTAEKVPVGPTKVAVASLYNAGGPMDIGTKMMMGGGKNSAPPPDSGLPEEARKMLAGRSAKRGLKIPDKYSDLENSGLTYTVTGGSQTKDFNLD